MFEPPGMPVEREIDHKIKRESGATPPYRCQYCISAAELAEVRCQLDEYLEKGWIRPSSSPYGAPIVFIRKKTGELRMTVDYRALNRQNKKDVYPLPRMDDLLDKLSKAMCLSAIDLASGYHQVQFAPDACEKTALVMQYGLFEYTVLPLGLCNAPSTFQHLMNSIMHGYVDDFVLVYLDDILMFSNTEDDHEDHLRKVFDQLCEHKLWPH